MALLTRLPKGILARARAVLAHLERGDAKRAAGALAELRDAVRNPGELRTVDAILRLIG